jgi:glycosyltransferase involved in cell wall biosynthesis
VIVCTRNEAANIGACLGALGRFDQVLVVDSGSDDGTTAVAAAHGATVVPFRWDGGYPKKKQWCLEVLPLRHAWAMHVDADEVVTPDLAEEIARLMARGPSHAGYFIEGRYVFLGRPLRFGLRNRKLMLLDRRHARFPPCDDLDVAGGWEVEGHYQPVIDGTVGRLRHPVLHWDRKSLAAWFDRHNRYSDWEAVLRHDGRRAAVVAADTPGRARLKRLFDRLPGKALAAFLHSYVLRLGVLDGAAGFHFALLRGFYYWQIGLKIRRLKADARDREGRQ